MDLTALAQQLTELLVPLIVYILGHGLVLLRRWRINETVLAAIARGAGAAYAELVRRKEGTTHAAIEHAVDIGAAYVERRVPDTLPKAGFVNTNAVRDAVRAQLGTLLAADPTVSPKGGA
jgi:hypothetical protein